MKNFFPCHPLIGAALLMCALQLNGLALDEQDLLFYAPLDGKLEAATARGEASPSKEPEECKFVEGHLGQGLLTGGANSQVIYATAGNMDLEAGSVCMWVKPMDWGKDSHMRFFFMVGGASEVNAGEDNEFLWLYKFFDESVYWLVRKSMPQTEFFRVAPASGGSGGRVVFDWTAKTWSHLIGTWSANQMSLYINGQYAGSTYVPSARIMGRLAKGFQIGGCNRRGNGTPDTVIDEVMILRQPVSPEEAGLIYEKGRGAFQPGATARAAPFLQMDATYSPTQNAVLMDSSLVGRRPGDLKGLKLVYEVDRENASKDAQDKKESKLLFKGEAAITELKQIHTIQSSELPEGAYCLHARLVDEKGGGRTLSSVASSFEKFAPVEWLGNTLGDLKEAPPPWSPIQIQDKKAACWGRVYDWGDGALPQQIKSQDRDLLARPITLVAAIGQERYSLEKAAIKWKPMDGGRLEFSATGQLGGLPVTIQGWLEYDGFLWCKFRVGDGKESAKIKLNGLALDIPLRDDVATLMQGGPPVPESGPVAKFRGILAGAPVIWLGNEKTGLQWSTEDLRDWRLKDCNNMAGLSLKDHEVVLRLTLVDHPVQLEKPLQFSMGFQATPVKPWNRNWRSWELPLVRSLATEQRPGWDYYWEQWNRPDAQSKGRYGYMVANDNTLADIQSRQARNLIPWIYWNQHLLWLGDPVLKAYGGEWGTAYDGKAGGYSSFTINHANPQVRDYLVWRIQKTLRETPSLARDIRGFYIDVAQAQWTRARAEGGKSDYSLFTILGTRELQKRFYQMLKKEWPDLLVANHQSGDVQMSQLAFADMMVTGEHLCLNQNLIKELGYYHVLTLDGMRAEYIGSNFGIPMVFLPETARAVGGDEAATRKIYGAEGIPASEHLLGMLWVHDVIPWPSYVNLNPIIQAARAKDAFGWDADTHFTGYWENGGLVQIKADRSPVVASVFQRKDRALFVIMNNSDAESRVELTPNWQALKIKAPAALVDAYAEQASNPVTEEAASSKEVSPTMIPLSNGIANVVVKARNFRALVAR